MAQPYIQALEFVEVVEFYEVLEAIVGEGCGLDLYSSKFLKLLVTQERGNGLT